MKQKEEISQQHKNKQKIRQFGQLTENKQKSINFANFMKIAIRSSEVHENKLRNYVNYIK